MQGRRVSFQPGWPGDWTSPGDYCSVPRGLDPREDGCWYVMTPDGSIGALSPSVHQIVEHQDGTITVTPSIVIPSSGWHGFLQHGIWS